MTELMKGGGRKIILIEKIGESNEIDVLIYLNLQHIEKRLEDVLRGPGR